MGTTGTVLALGVLGVATAYVVVAVRSLGPPDFSPEYRRATDGANPRWRFLRTIAFLVTCGRDPLVPLLRAQELHHLTYRRLGHELPLVDVVPLSHATHRVITLLRKTGLRELTNLVLRVAYGLWIGLWCYGAFRILSLVTHL